VHRSNLGAKALSEAIKDYEEKNRRNEALIFKLKAITE